MRVFSPDYQWRKKTVLDCDGWLSRETEIGYESSPNASKFSNVKELNVAKNIWRDRASKQAQGGGGAAHSTGK